MRTLTDCDLHVEGVGLESRARHGTADFPLGCYRDGLGCTPVPAHWHDALELSVVAEGRAEYLLGTRRVVLGRGEGVFVNAGTLHAIAPASPDALTDTVVFFPRLVAGDVESVFWQRYVGPLVRGGGLLPAMVLNRDIPWQAACLDAASDVLAAFCDEGFGYEFRVREALSRAVCAFAAEFARLSSAHPRSVVRPCPDGSIPDDAPGASAPGAPVPAAELRRSDRLKAMISCVHERYAADLRVEEVAASASVSVSECLRCFREVLGTTPMRYVREYRVRQAARLISEGVSATDAASACGFSDASYFTKAFRACLGVTPSEYRRRARAGE